MTNNTSLNLSGLVVNSLTVLERTNERRGSEVMWRCRCVCGSALLVRASTLNTGRIKSCGCKTKEILRAARSTHGLSKTEPKTFRVWRGMRERCEKEHHKSYVDYGERGIAVCERWQNFGLFFADMGRVPEGMTIERIDNNGDYEPGNCRWATRKEQANNRRGNVFVTHEGTRLTMAQLAEAVAIPRDTIDRRLKMGWPMDRALSQPVRPQKNNRVAAA